MAKRLGPGRPPFEITDKVLKKVEELAAKGANQRWASMALGISDELFSQRKGDNLDFLEAWQRGRAIWSERILAAAPLIIDGLIVNATTPTKESPGGSTAAQLGYLSKVLGVGDDEGQAKAKGTGEEVREVIFRVTNPKAPSFQRGNGDD